jgi:hypothetical protein
MFYFELFGVFILITCDLVSGSVAAANIVFDLPDLVVIQSVEQRTVQIEAFKSHENDKIMAKSDSKYLKHLMWVSVGSPRLVPMFDRTDDEEKLFHFTNEGFYSHVEMLTVQQRELFRLEIEHKHSIKISIRQIVNLPLLRFSCGLRIHDNGTQVLVTGAVTNFQVFPLRVDFLAPLQSYGRRLIESALENEDAFDLPISCEISSEGDVEKQNKFTISTTQLNQMDLIDGLFGAANSTLVTRRQMNAFMNQVYAKMNVTEEYEMAEYRFKGEFVEDFIKQVLSSEFESIDIDTALSKLSKYALNFDRNDLKPNVIKHEMGRIFRTFKTGNKSAIRVDGESVDDLVQKGYLDVGGGLNANFLNITSVGGGGGAQVTENKKLLLATKSVFENLTDLNSVFEDEVEWEQVGEKIVPKSLKVARLLKSSFSKNLEFNRIRKEKFKTTFTKKMSIYS